MNILSVCNRRMPNKVATQTKPLRKVRRALSLLEVVLALSILGIAASILSQILQQSADNGLRARRITQAQMFCESKMAEAMAGALPLQSTQWTPITGSITTAQWYYSLQTVAAEQKNMMGVMIEVNDSEGMQANARPLARLVQWIIDPNLGLDTKSTTTSGTAGGTSGGTSSGSTGSTQGGIQ